MGSCGTVYGCMCFLHFESGGGGGGGGVVFAAAIRLFL